MQRPEFLASGELARLIPTVPESSKEVRTTSILLSALMAVPPFARSILGSIGVRVGKLARIECFTEVVLIDTATDIKVRPDGLIIVSTGRQQWRALVEAKCANNMLEEPQVEAYLELARRNGIDAVITISNQLVALPTHHPLSRIRRSPKGPTLFHWSWMHLLTEATLLISQSPKEFDDPEQRYILSEVVRFFRHSTSGISRLDRMNAEWKDLVAAIQHGVTLSRTAPDVINTVAYWHQVQRNICLQLSRKLNRGVELKLSKSHIDNPEVRLKDDCESLIESRQLGLAVNVPDTAAPIVVSVDLVRRNVTCSMQLQAPADRKSSAARINWLTRQLQNVTGDNVHLRATWPGRAATTQVTLARAKENPDSLVNPNSTAAVTTFEILMIHDLAGDFGRNIKFIERLENVLPDFYEQIASNLRAWVPTPPKMNLDILAKPEEKIILSDNNLHPITDEENNQAIGSEIDLSETPNEERELAANLSVAAAMSSEGVDSNTLEE